MTHRTRIKVCGLRREADVAAAVEAGADAIGFVFYAKSPVPSRRPMRPAWPGAAALCDARGLFVNASDAELGAALDAVPNMLLQFHGDETALQCERVQRPYIRAARMAPGFDLLNFAASFPSAQAILLDAHVEGYGGGGKVFDWSLLPSKRSLPVVLSGGLSARQRRRWHCTRPALGR